MGKLKTIARPYALAAFEFSCENNNILKWKKMLMFASLFSKNKKMINYLIFSNSISNEYKIKYIKSIFVNYIDRNFENFLKILLKNKRFYLIHEIFKYFINLCDKKNKIKNITLTASHKLNKNQIKKVIYFLEKKISVKINLHIKIDKFLISGFKINLDGSIIDISIRNRINKLNNILRS